MTENELQREILNLLSHIPNTYCFRSSSGLIRTEKGNYFRTGKRGCPDIVCCIKARFIGLEVKKEKGKLSAFQKQAREEIEKAGGKYAVVRNMEDIELLISKL